MSVSQRRISAGQIEGMDACIRDLAVIVEQAREWSIGDPVLAFLESGVEGITEQWVSMRGRIPEAVEE